MLMTVFGRRGSGKTTLIRALISKLKKPIVVIDILGNFDPSSPEGEKWKKEQSSLKSDSWIQCESHVDALEEIKAYVQNPKNHCGVIVVRDSDVNRCVDYMCSALWHIRGGTLVIDEADAIDGKEAPCFDEAIRYGRNKGIDIITGCRRPAEISRNVTAGSDIAYCLTTQEPRDIDYYCDFLGEEKALALKDLPPHHGIYRDFSNQSDGFFKTESSGKIIILDREKIKTTHSREKDENETSKKVFKSVDTGKKSTQNESIDLPN